MLINKRIQPIISVMGSKKLILGTSVLCTVWNKRRTTDMYICVLEYKLHNFHYHFFIF